MSAKRWDLIVLGGGLTGVAAAVAARRNGLNTLIIEKSGCLGGAPANYLINPFMPFWTTVENNGKKEQLTLSRGIFSEIERLLGEIGGLRETYFHEEYLKLALDRMTRQEGVEVLLHACFCGADVRDECIKSVRVATKAGELRLEADAYIDCSGDADLAVAAGCPCRLGRPGDGLCQPMTLCFRIANVDLDKYHAYYPEINKLYLRLHQEGRFRNPREDVLIFDTLTDGMLHFNTTRVIQLNPVDPFDLTKAEMEAREQMFEMFYFLKENIPGFEQSELAYSAAEIGVRESRMIDGEYVLTENDLKDCLQFDDRIAAGNYDIDIHNPAGGDTSHYYFAPGTWYTIPYRSLVPRGVKNLLVAGRCISATQTYPVFSAF